jgi:hypothetical protein
MGIFKKRIYLFLSRGVFLRNIFFSFLSLEEERERERESVRAGGGAEC